MSEENNFTKLSVPNAEQDKFREKLKKINHGKYEVEQLNDGKKIIIKKPGRKGHNDFRVYLYDPKLSTKKLLSHNEIFKDIESKYKKNPEKTKELIYGLNDVCNGKEPDDVIKERKIENITGLPADTLYKTLKWIWGEEDCNYIKGKGRWMSMDGINEEYEIEIKNDS